MINKLAIYAAVVLTIGGGVFYISSLRDKVDALETEVSTQKLQIQIHADNVELLTKQLAFEEENNQIGNDAIVELKGQVPDADFNTPLSPAIQDVLDRFHSRINP